MNYRFNVSRLLPKKSLNCGKIYASKYFRVSTFDCTKKNIFQLWLFRVHCLFTSESLSFRTFFLASAFWNSILDSEMILHCSFLCFYVSISALIHYRFICERGFSSTVIKITKSFKGWMLKYNRKVCEIPKQIAILSKPKIFQLGNISVLC